MRKTGVGFFLLLTFAMSALAVAASDGDKKAVTNKMCPVMNSPVSEKIRSEYKGQYVYFCCQGCLTMFEKDPETYVAKLSKEDREAITANEVCPITKEKIPDQTKFVEQDGRKIYFCCDGCLSMYKAKMAEKKNE
jgi:YHS domain-containing protein